MKKILVALLVAMLLLCGAALATQAPACPHANTTVKLTPPACVADGNETTYCVDCGEELNRVIIEAPGHDWAKASDFTADAKQHHQVLTCKDCGVTEKDSNAHTFVTIGVAKPADCTNDGYETLYCKDCGYYTTKTIKAEGHYWVGEFYKDPTCTEQGFYRERCPKCGEEKVTYIKALGHNWSSWIQTSAALCTVDGSQYRVCFACDAREVKVIKATGHKFDAARIEVIKKDGKTYLSSNCLICHETITKEYTGKVPSTNDASQNVVGNPAGTTGGGNAENSTANKPTTNKAGVTIPATGETTSIAPIMMVLAIAGLAVLAATKQKVNG